MSQPVVKYSTGPLPRILMEASKVYTERIVDKTCKIHYEQITNMYLFNMSDLSTFIASLCIIYMMIKGTNKETYCI